MKWWQLTYSWVGQGWPDLTITHHRRARSFENAIKAACKNVAGYPGWDVTITITEPLP